VSRAYAEVIGDPIAQSKSPMIHGFWLAKLGIEADYRSRRVAAEQLAGYFAERRTDALWRGCNVTVPHKLAALALAERRDALAAAIGATNCIARVEGGALAATNTDADGFGEPIAGIDLAGLDAVIVGAGGAARAILAKLRARGIGSVTVMNRSQDRARALLAEMGFAGNAVPLDAALPRSCVLLVNSSVLGMDGQPPLALDLATLPAEAVVYDIVYAPLETGLLLAARSRGLRTIDGLAMLIGQAAIAFQVFFGAPAPREHDRELRALLGA
jgi:shikimate dehydrogenase